MRVVLERPAISDGALSRAQDKEYQHMAARTHNKDRSKKYAQEHHHSLIAGDVRSLISFMLTLTIFAVMVAVVLKAL
jgi:hypothetical protein